MVVEDRGVVDTGSDHNVVWSVFKVGNPKEMRQRGGYSNSHQERYSR